ncbi:MAG: DPP IV N-terminal domain-containing protein [Bacteroidales bacterium]|jgi:dipeptidyl-peptidase-4
MRKYLSLSILISGFIVLFAPAQQLSIEQAVLQTGLYPAKPAYVWGGPVGSFLQVRNGGIVSTSARSGKETEILNRDEFNRLIQAAGLAPVQGLSLPEVLQSGNLRFKLGKAIVDIDWNQKILAGKLAIPEGSDNLVMDPGGYGAAYTIGPNVYLSDYNGTVTQVTADLENGIVSGASVSRDEFGISSGLFWSPKNSLLAFYRKDERKVTEYPLVNIMNTPATATMIRYPMAGGASEVIAVGIYNISDRSTVFLEETAFGDDRYLTGITWDPTGSYLYAAVLNREQNHMLLNQYDARTGKKIKTLFEESSEKYVEPLKGMIFNPNDPGQFIWFSQRDGFNHMYLHRTDGSLVRQLTQGEWVVTDFIDWDSRGRFVYFRSTDQSPLERHIYRLDLVSGTRLPLTPDPGTHEVLISPDGKFYLDSYSSYTVPRRILLRETGSRESRTLLDAPNPLAGLNMGEYRPFTIKAADKKTDLYGYLVLPANMDPAIKYPVIVYVYGGPHAQLVVNSWMGGASGWQHYMAQEGFISMTLDNRGSDARGAAFEQVIHRNLGRAEMADQMQGIDYLFTLPFVDSNRIGVHGWSYGGFMTTSLILNFPDVFKAGVAGGPVIDWKYYEVMYGERYMDLPSENLEGYALTSTLSMVKNLRGRFMLIHGDNDPTVVWQNSLMFVRKCIDEGKLIDYMVYPQHPHNVRGKDRVHLMRTVTRYFQDNL